eukprot:6639738-Lingulodinium_polyedra.AAC.1
MGLLHPGRFRRVDWEENCEKAVKWMLTSPLADDIRGCVNGDPRTMSWQQLAQQRDPWKML